MTVHQCPKCPLRFDRRTELDYHCRTEHPEFRHEYPVAKYMGPDGKLHEAPTAEPAGRPDES